MAVLGLGWGRPAATFWVQFGTGGSARGLGDRRLCPGRRWQVMRDHVGPLFRLCARSCARLCARGRGYARGYARSLVALRNSEILCAPTLLIMREVMRGGRGYARSYARGFGGVLTSYDILRAPVFQLLLKVIREVTGSAGLRNRSVG